MHSLLLQLLELLPLLPLLLRQLPSVPQWTVEQSRQPQLLGTRLRWSFLWRMFETSGLFIMAHSVFSSFRYSLVLAAVLLLPLQGGRQ